MSSESKGPHDPHRIRPGEPATLRSAEGDDNAGALMASPLAQLQRQLRLLSSCHRVLIRAHAENELLAEICRLLTTQGDYALAWIGMRENERAPLRAVAVADGAPMSEYDAANLARIAWLPLTAPDMPAVRACAEHTLQMVYSFDEQAWNEAWRTESRRRGYGAAFSIPLDVDGNCIGVLEVYARNGGTIDISELTLLCELADDLAYGIAMTRVRQESQRQQSRVVQLTRLLRMQSAVNGAVLRVSDRQQLLQETCRVAVEVGRYDTASIWMTEPGTRTAYLHCQAGRPLKHVLPDRLTIADGNEPDRSLTGRTLRTGEISFCGDLTRSEPTVINREQLFVNGVRSIVCLPLMVEGQCVGSLSLCSRETELLRDDELQLLQDVVASLSFALRSQQNAHAAEYLSHYDPLTGLANRSLFCQRLDLVLRRRSNPIGQPTVATLDVHHLSSLNDSFGRHFGDLLLQEIAARLKAHAGNDEYVGYLSGGKFVLSEPTQGTLDKGIASLLDETVFGQPFVIDGRSVRVSYRSGVARFPADGEDGSTLVQKAEAALQHAKQAGEQYLHYKLEMHSEIAERMALEHRLREAIDQQQFELHYQPQVSIHSGRIESVEALLRWNDPEQGLVAPARFLPLLESSGLIIPVGRWVTERAAQDLRRLQRAGLGPLRIAINVSPLQIRRRTFVDQLLDLAKQLPDPSLGYGLDLEITETALLQDLDGTSRRLRDLRSAGYRIALDDFGTGYSSLGLLSKLPVDLLKIDRSFVQGIPGDMTSMTLTRSIISLASAFGLLTVAEGVETIEQATVLRVLKCDQSQGYYHCKPVPLEHIERLLGESNPG